eukprot:CAMPEP_0175456840 /NCGR_PEP_ID=MMETSP0095-20121207/65747_1 /TAXON_ID=311494 /ORGANISM="Alexandrium monilatum, Strain CCMP3105" /LENGTH=157 /DNA_ID=CAMNT_0016757665 /DNA_START=20 /DNA_END=493 /DNA_ORIENTATION=+
MARPSSSASVAVPMVVLSLLALARAQPPAPAPPVPPVQPTPTPTTTLSQDQLDDLMTQKELTALADAKINFKRGAWLYGDYATEFNVPDAISCHRLCEADSGCSHWNYQATGGKRCDLKSGTGGFNEDASSWISGDTFHAPLSPAPPPPTGSPTGDL